MSCRPLPHFTDFHCTRRHHHTVDFPPQPQRGTQRGGGRPALAATFSTRAAALAAVPAKASGPSARVNEHSRGAQ